MTRQERKYLNSLNRRAEHLERRIQESTKDLTYDRQELAALKWAIRSLTPADVKLPSNLL